MTPEGLTIVLYVYLFLLTLFYLLFTLFNIVLTYDCRARGHQRVWVPMTQVVVRPMPKPGSVVTVAYDVAARRELPVNPRVVRVRHEDFDWPSYTSRHSDSRALNGILFYTS